MTLLINADGGCRGNPGLAAIGFIIRHNTQILVKKGKTIGTATNNIAEYQAVIEALSWIKDNKQSFLSKVGETEKKQLTIKVYLDSNLVVNQLNKNFKIKKPHLKNLANQVYAITNFLDAQVNYFYIPREDNQEADLLLNNALDNIS